MVGELTDRHSPSNTAGHGREQHYAYGRIPPKDTILLLSSSTTSAVAVAVAVTPSIAITASMAIAVHLRRCHCCCRQAVHCHRAFHRRCRCCRRVAIAPSLAIASPSSRPSPSLQSIVIAVAPSIAAVAVASPSPCRPCPLPCCPHPLFAGWLLHQRLHLLSSPVSCLLSSSLPPPPCPLSRLRAGCHVDTSASHLLSPLVHCRSPCRCLLLLFLGGGPCHRCC